MTNAVDSAGSDLGLELGAVGRFSSNRCIGLEQEFLLADEGIVLSNRADEFLDACREAARAAGRNAESFAPECAKSMVEVNTPPVRSLAELAREYPTGLETGHSARETLEVLLGSDPEPEKRQLGIVDL
jgi:hypothetical protein